MEDIKLADIIDLKFLQEFQDTFAKSFNMACLIVEAGGPVTNPSNFSDACTFIRSTNSGIEKCSECHLKWGKLSAEKKEPIIHNCHLGLTAFSVPILIDGKHIATIMGGQVFTEKPNEEHFNKVALDLGIDDNQYLEAIRKIRIVPLEQVQTAVQLLYVVSKSISEVANKNYQLIKKAKRDALLDDISKVIRSSFDCNEIKKYFVEVVGSYFNADRCLFADYDPQQKKFYPPSIQRLKKEEVKRFVIPDADAVPEFIKKLNAGKSTIIRDVEKTISRTGLDKFKTLQSLRENGILSDYGLPVKYKDQLLGALILHFTEEKKILTHDEFEFLKVLRDQVGIALYQTILLDEKKQIAKNESILSRIILASSSSSSFEQIINSIVTEAGKFFGADRCFFVTSDLAANTNLPIEEYAEYLSSSSVRSHREVPYKKEETSEFVELTKTHKIMYVENINELELPEAARHMLIDELSVKSYLIATVKYNETIYGAIVYHYVNDSKKFSANDLSMAEAMANQSAIIINQSKLYEKSKKQVKQETLLRNISERIRSSLDIDETLGIITYETAHLFNVDRISIVEFPDKDNLKNHIIRKEHKVTDDIKSPWTVEDYTNNGAFIADYIINSGKPLVINNINESDFDESIINFYKALEVKSLVWIPIISKGNELWGFITLSSIKNYKNWIDEDISFINSISSQIYIAINQSELYEEAQKNAENESILRRIMLSSSSTFSFEQTINLLVTEAGKLFNADRCFFIEVDTITHINLPIQEYAEYLSSPNILSHLEVIPKKSETKTFVSRTLIHENVYVENINDINLPEATRQMLVEKLSVKSYMIMTVKYGETVYGALVFHYVNQYKKFSEKEMSLAEAMASQSANIINQVKLYSKVQQQSEKEFLLRQITQDIGSSLNADDIFSYVCKGLAEIFNIQRVTIIQYPDSKDYSKYNTVKEYKLDSKITGSSDFGKRPSDYPFYHKFGQAWIEFLETQKDYVAINNIQESDMPSFLKESYETFGQKALMLANISNGKEKWGIIILSEYNCPRNWTDADVNLMEMISDQLYIAIKQSELYSQMQQQAEREKAILSNLPFMVWLKDKESKFLAVNEPFAKACGQPPESLVGKSDYDIWPKELADKYVKDDLAIMENQKTSAVEELIQGEDGVRWHETQKTPLFNEKGEIVGTTGFSRDITERKEIDRMKNEFVSMVSHELRTPLTSIRGSLGLVTSGKIETLSDKTQGLLEIANNNCLRLINLINDILDIEKIEAGKMDFQIEILNLVSVVEQTIQANLQFAQKHGVEIKLEKELEEIFVKVDGNRLIQVITNLLSNAIKFSEKTAPVVISIKRENIKNNVKVSIINYGKEIPADFKNRIFQKFAQADSSDARQKGGTGLGLSIAKAIVEKLQGTIGFESQNKKTAFYFDLPEFTQEQPVVRNRIDGSKPNILICEDDKDIAALLNIFLEQENYCADISYNAKQAQQLLEERDYDALLLDLILPDKDGLTLIKELRESKKTENLPIIVVSVKAKEGSQELDGRFAVFDWIDKPIQKDRLLNALNLAMSNTADKPKILHVEDNEDIKKVTYSILKDNAKVSQVGTLEDAKNILASDNFDLLLLDLELPDGNGSELLPLLKNEGNNNIITVIFSAHDVNDDIAKQVDAVLLKSNTSNEDLLKIINLIRQKKYSKSIVKE